MNGKGKSMWCNNGSNGRHVQISSRSGLREALRPIFRISSKLREGNRLSHVFVASRSAGESSVMYGRFPASVIKGGRT